MGSSIIGHPSASGTYDVSQINFADRPDVSTAALKVQNTGVVFYQKDAGGSGAGFYRIGPAGDFQFLGTGIGALGGTVIGAGPTSIPIGPAVTIHQLVAAMLVGDTVLLQLKSAGDAGAGLVYIQTVSGAGAFDIFLRNIAGAAIAGPVATAFDFNYVVMRF